MPCGQFPANRLNEPKSQSDIASRPLLLHLSCGVDVLVVWESGPVRDRLHRFLSPRILQQARTHLALQKDAPLTIQRSGVIVAIPILAGPHHSISPDMIFVKERC
jgi:hypothetical protein